MKMHKGKNVLFCLLENGETHFTSKCIEKLLICISGKKVVENGTDNKNVKSSTDNKSKETSSDESSDSDYDLEENVAPAAGVGAANAKNKDGIDVVTEDPGNYLTF